MNKLTIPDGKYEPQEQSEEQMFPDDIEFHQDMTMLHACGFAPYTLRRLKREAVRRAIERSEQNDV